MKILTLEEQIGYADSPHGHLCTPQGNFRDAHNWQHSTMYLFFALFGIFRAHNHKNPESITQGKNTYFGLFRNKEVSFWQ